MSDKKSDSSDFSLDISDANQRSSTTEKSDSQPLFLNLEKMDASGSDRSTPARARTMKEYDQQIGSLQKENFNLKLRIYFLEEDARKRFGGAKDDFYQLNIELKVEVESLRKELQDKDVLLKKASSALNSLMTNHEAEMKAFSERSEVSSKDEVNRLREEIVVLRQLFKTKEEEIEMTNESLSKANNKISELIHEKGELSLERKKQEEEIKEMNKNAEMNLIDFSSSDKNISLLQEQVVDYEDELDKKNKLIDQLRCALMVKDVLIEQVESEMNEVELKFKDTSIIKDSDDDDDDDYKEGLHNHDDLVGSELMGQDDDNDDGEDYEQIIDANKYTLAMQPDQPILAENRDHERFVLEGFVEKLSNRLKDREDFIKECRRKIKDLEDKCFSLMQIIDELRSVKSDGECHNDYDDNDCQYHEGLKSSWSQLHKSKDDEKDDEGDTSIYNTSFNNISHLEFKNISMWSYEDLSGSTNDINRRSSTCNDNSNQNKTGDQNVGKLKKLEDENVHLKDRLWVMERHFEEWKDQEKFDHQELERSLKAELERALEAKDGLEEQCSELEDELFRIKKHFGEFGSFIIDFDDVPLRDSLNSQSPDFMERLTGLREVFARQERLLKDNQEMTSHLEVKNTEYKSAVEKHKEEADRLKRTMEEKIKTLLEDLDENKHSLTSLTSNVDKLNQELLAKEQELQALSNRLNSERDSLAERCKELEVVNFKLNDNLMEVGRANEALSKNLATSDALGQQLNNLLKEGGDITMQLNMKAEKLSQTNEDLVLKLQQTSDMSSAYEVEISQLRKLISEKESLVKQLTGDLAKLVDGNNRADELEKKLACWNDLIGSYELKILRQETLIRELNEKLSNMCMDIRDISHGVEEARCQMFQDRGIPTIQLENITQKKEQLLDMMQRKKEAAMKSGKDDLVGQWSELVCTIEKEWKEELTDIKAMEDKWQLIMIENQTLMSERNDMECQIRNLNAVIQELQAKFAQSRGDRKSAGDGVQGETSLSSKEKVNHGSLLQENCADRFYLKSIRSSENNSKSNDKISDSSQAVVGEFETLTPVEQSCHNFKLNMESPQESSLQQSEIEMSSSIKKDDSASDYDCKLKQLRDEVNTCNDIISHLKEQIALNTETSESSGKLKFNPELIVHLVRKLHSYKTDPPKVGSQQPLQTPVGKDSGLEDEKISKQESRESDIFSERKTKLIETLKEDVTKQKKQIKSAIYNSRLSFGRLSGIPLIHEHEASSYSNRATIASMKEISHPSLVPDFDSTHIDEFNLSAQEFDFRDARENVLVDMLAESEGRNCLMKTRLEELLIFLKKILSIRGGTLDKEMTDFLDETEGLLANMSQWFKERNTVLETSLINLEDSFLRCPSRASFVSRPSLVVQEVGADVSSSELGFQKQDVDLELHQQEIHNLSEMLDKETKKREELESEVERLKTILDERSQLIQNLQQDIGSLRSQITELQGCVEGLMSENKSLKETAVDAERKLADEVEVLNRQLHACGLVIKQLEMSAKFKENESDIDQQKILELELIKENNSESIKDLKINIEDLNSELERARQICQHNSSVVEKMTEDLKISTESTQRYKSQCMKVSEDYSKLKKELISRDGELEDSITKLIEAEGRIADFHSTVESLNHQIEILHLEKKSLEKILSEERHAVKLTLFGDANELDSNKSFDFKSARDSFSMFKTVGEERHEGSALQAKSDKLLLSVGCVGCTRLEDRLVSMAEERDALLRKLMEMSRKSSILTSEVVCHLDKENRSFGRSNDGGEIGLIEESIRQLQCIIIRSKDLVDCSSEEIEMAFKPCKDDRTKRTDRYKQVVKLLREIQSISERLFVVSGETLEADSKMEQDESIIHCDHSGFLAEIENLKKQIESMQHASAFSPNKPVEQDWCGIERSEIIDQINKTRKVLAMTSMNLKPRYKKSTKDTK